MNRLKRNIIYQYILVSVILVLSSVYLSLIVEKIKIFDEYNYAQWGTVWFIVGLIIACIFIVCAYWFYKKINVYIKDEMESQLKKQNKLFADIAHDIKNPMTSILGLSRALESDIVDKNEEKEVIRLITQKIKRVDKIVNLMFQYAKMDSTEYKLNKKQFNLSSVLKKLVAERYSEFEEREIDLNIAIENEDVTVWLDELEILRVIDNLITNVLVHNSHGIKVEIGLRQDTENITLWVADSGEIISREMQEKIFEPFVCEDESRNSKGGTGLGLAISKKIIELHNGEIFVENNFNGYNKAFILMLKNDVK